jgi:hypothetical protein
MYRYAMRGPAASLRARSKTSSNVAIALTRPSPTASSAVTRSEKKYISRAFAGPTSRVKNHVPP